MTHWTGSGTSGTEQSKERTSVMQVLPGNKCSHMHFTSNLTILKIKLHYRLSERWKLSLLSNQPVVSLQAYLLLVWLSCRDMKVVVLLVMWLKIWLVQQPFTWCVQALVSSSDGSDLQLGLVYSQLEENKTWKPFALRGIIWLCLATKYIYRHKSPKKHPNNLCLPCPLSCSHGSSYINR